MNDRLAELTGKKKDYHKNITSIFPQINSAHFPLDQEERIVDIDYDGKKYRVTMRRISLEAVSTYPEARGALVLGLATFIVTFALPADDAERAIIETAESYLGETAEGEPLGALEALFGRALALWSAEQ